MRCISDELKKRYFKYHKNEYVLSEEIKNRVNFSYVNLCDMQLPAILSETNAQDLIICRNVLIYFDDEHVAKLMKRFAGSLVERGYLLLGASDPIVLDETKFTYHYRAGALFSFELAENRKENKKNEVPTPMPIVSTVAPKPKELPKIKQAFPEPLSQQQVRTIDSLMNDSNWHEAFKIINGFLEKGIQSVYLLNNKATVCANLGKLNEAIDLLQKSLNLEPMNTLTYFTLAMTLLELNKLTEAEAAFRKSLYLDHQFLVGHFQLGLLLLRNKQEKEGLKHLQNALNIAKRKDPLAKVTGFNELQYGQLADIFANEIKLHTARGKSHDTKK